MEEAAGASEAGQTPASGSNKVSGNGGDGLAYAITGSSITYAGGGAGHHAGSGSSGGTGGSGGGGNPGSQGTDGLGAGGGGNSGDGGNGTIIMRVLTQTSSTGIAATGSFEGNAITVPSTSKMGAMITYQDNAGTNALNSDIILQLSADNGSNYSTATLTAMPDFSSGIKMAKVNDLAVTAGTQLKYKILFANQASGSKEARIRGVSLNY